MRGEISRHHQLDEKEHHCQKQEQLDDSKANLFQYISRHWLSIRFPFSQLLSLPFEVFNCLPCTIREMSLDRIECIPPIDPPRFEKLLSQVLDRILVTALLWLYVRRTILLLGTPTHTVYRLHQSVLDAQVMELVRSFV